MTLAELVSNGVVAAIGLLIITLQVRVGNRLTKVETKLDERLKTIERDGERLSDKLSSYENENKSFIYKIEKAYDMGKRSHQRLDSLQDMLNRFLENKED